MNWESLSQELKYIINILLVRGSKEEAKEQRMSMDSFQPLQSALKGTSSGRKYHSHKVFFSNAQSTKESERRPLSELRKGEKGRGKGHKSPRDKGKGSDLNTIMRRIYGNNYNPSSTEQSSTKNRRSLKPGGSNKQDPDSLARDYIYDKTQELLRAPAPISPLSASCGYPKPMPLMLYNLPNTPPGGYSIAVQGENTGVSQQGSKTGRAQTQESKNRLFTSKKMKEDYVEVERRCRVSPRGLHCFEHFVQGIDEERGDNIKHIMKGLEHTLGDFNSLKNISVPDGLDRNSENNHKLEHYAIKRQLTILPRPRRPAQQVAAEGDIRTQMDDELFDNKGASDVVRSMKDMKTLGIDEGYPVISKKIGDQIFIKPKELVAIQIRELLRKRKILRHLKKSVKLSDRPKMTYERLLAEGKGSLRFLMRELKENTDMISDTNRQVDWLKGLMTELVKKFDENAEIMAERFPEEFNEEDEEDLRAPTLIGTRRNNSQTQSKLKYMNKLHSLHSSGSTPLLNIKGRLSQPKRTGTVAVSACTRKDCGLARQTSHILSKKEKFERDKQLRVSNMSDKLKNLKKPKETDLLRKLTKLQEIHDQQTAACTSHHKFMRYSPRGIWSAQNSPSLSMVKVDNDRMKLLSPNGEGQETNIKIERIERRLSSISAELVKQQETSPVEASPVFMQPVSPKVQSFKLENLPAVDAGYPLETYFQASTPIGRLIKGLPSNRREGQSEDSTSRLSKISPRSPYQSIPPELDKSILENEAIASNLNIVSLDKNPYSKFFGGRKGNFQKVPLFVCHSNGEAVRISLPTPRSTRRTPKGEKEGEIEIDVEEKRLRLEGGTKSMTYNRVCPPPMESPKYKRVGSADMRGGFLQRGLSVVDQPIAFEPVIRPSKYYYNQSKEDSWDVDPIDPTGKGRSASSMSQQTLSMGTMGTIGTMGLLSPGAPPMSNNWGSKIGPPPLSLSKVEVTWRGAQYSQSLSATGAPTPSPPIIGNKTRIVIGTGANQFIDTSIVDATLLPISSTNIRNPRSIKNASVNVSSKSMRNRFA